LLGNLNHVAALVHHFENCRIKALSGIGLFEDRREIAGFNQLDEMEKWNEDSLYYRLDLGIWLSVLYLYQLLANFWLRKSELELWANCGDHGVVGPLLSGVSKP
jgi:hypothetical protein